MNFEQLHPAVQITLIIVGGIVSLGFLLLLLIGLGDFEISLGKKPTKKAK